MVHFILSLGVPNPWLGPALESDALAVFGAATSGGPS